MKGIASLENPLPQLAWIKPSQLNEPSTPGITTGLEVGFGDTVVYGVVPTARYCTMYPSAGAVAGGVNVMVNVLIL